MNRNTLKYLVDVGLAITFLATFITGIIKFPELRFLDINFGLFSAYEVTLIHDWGGVAMGAFVFIHLVLNWGWVVATTKGIFRKK